MIKTQNFCGLFVYTDGTQSTNFLNVGYITLRCKDRCFVIDAGKYYIFPEESITRTEYNVFLIDSEEYKECAFDLTEEDLLDDELVVSVWIDGEEFEDEVTSITLAVDINGVKRYIDCIEE